MSEPKYYKPSIEELYVGFEYQEHEASRDWEGSPEHNYDRWVDKVMNPLRLETALKYGVRSIRVKYLDREDIESLGWIPHFEPPLFKIGEFLLRSEGTKHLIIKHNPDELDVRFSGTIRNKSELARVMKMVGITKE